VIADLLPAGAAVGEAFCDVPGELPHPQEQPLIARAVSARRSEFVTARRCAREALTRLGLPPVAILAGPRGEPVWPDGVTGSITHCAGYRAAAVAHRSTVASLGIDAETHAPLPDGVIDAVTGPAERTRLAALTDRHPAICWDRLLFSAKESVYKAWFPLTRRMLGFEEADVSFDASTSTFAAQLLVPGTRADGAAPLTGFTGRWLVKGDLVVTAVTVAA
jgi:4'-phosphopantetheinyl transferase EntD